MKNILLLSLGFSSLGFSQITIDSLHMPVKGDTILMSSAIIDPALDFQSTGPDFTWDFSNLEWNAQIRNDYNSLVGAGPLIQINFGNFAAVKYKASYSILTNSFPTLPSQIPIQIEDVNQYYRLTADSMTMVGMKLTINGQQVPAKSDTIETIYKFPLEYGDTHFSRGATSLDMNPIYDAQWRQHRTRETTVDGWGTITTPFGTFNSLRIHHKIMEKDSFYLSFNGFGTWVPLPLAENHEYEWRAVEEKEPVLLVKTTMAQGTENISSVEYRNVYTVGLEENMLEISMFPNPVQDLLQINSQEILESYTIFSTDGKIIMQAKLVASNQQMIDVSQLKKGSYLIQIQSGNRSTTKSFVK